MKRKNYILLSIIFILFICIFFSDNVIHVITHLFNHKSYNVTIVIDAGHGGFDPGKIGINHALEKEINLSIAYKLKSLLEQNDINVVMTRKDSNGLYKKSDQNLKQADMKRRIDIINSSGALIAISIHQNSFTQESSKGAQMFYYLYSEEGKILAETLQERIKTYINDGNHRLAKANSSYYMLKYSSCPLVIVECGFLSNRKEAELLCDPEYQNKMALAIYFGLIEYLNNKMNLQANALAMNKNVPLVSYPEQ